MTTIREKLPGRPPVEPYLHGISEWEPPQTHVVWREEVGLITGELLDTYKPQDLLDDYPLKPYELLRDCSNRVLKHLVSIAKCHPDKPAWLVGDHGTVEVVTLKKLVDKNKKDRINNMTVLLPPSVGGLNNGLLDGKAPATEDGTEDVADKWYQDEEHKAKHRVRVWGGDDQFEEKIKGMRLVGCINWPGPEEDEDAMGKSWHWYIRPKSADDVSSKSSNLATTWDHHTKDVTERATQIADALNLPDALHKALILAAQLHDLGKRRDLWQRCIGNDHYPDKVFAKSGRLSDGGQLRRRNLGESYRHEFGSLLDVLDPQHPQQQKYFGELQKLDLVLHLIAAHHGYARPHFPQDSAYDHEHNVQDADALAIEVPRRFVRLQRQYGRWGLAYLESLLRAADWAASANPSGPEEEKS